MSLVIDNATGDILGDAIRNLPTRHERYQAAMRGLLDASNAPQPRDGHAHMAQRVAMVAATSPQARASAGLHAKQALAWDMTTQERRNWIDGQGQTRG